MKKIFLFLFVSALVVSFVSTNDSSAQEKTIYIACDGTHGHCVETPEVIYYGTARATDNELDEVIITIKKN